MTVHLVIFLPKIPYVNRIHMVLANPTHKQTLCRYRPWLAWTERSRRFLHHRSSRGAEVWARPRTGRVGQTGQHHRPPCRTPAVESQRTSHIAAQERESVCVCVCVCACVYVFACPRCCVLKLQRTPVSCTKPLCSLSYNRVCVPESLTLVRMRV